MLDLLSSQDIAILQHMGAAVIAGGVIGLERSHQGRPAGFRTHTLVCLASSMLMVLTLYATTWFPGATAESMRMDPTRMAQGIMTGIGFLGAGVIYKEGISVRGLTTAASIWITAALGILIGAGLYFPAAVATAMTVSILAFFPVVERALPRKSYVHFNIVVDRESHISESDVVTMAAKFGFGVRNTSYHAADGGSLIEYRMALRSRKHADPSAFAAYLGQQTTVRSFQIYPSGD